MLKSSRRLIRVVSHFKREISAHKTKNYFHHLSLRVSAQSWSVICDLKRVNVVPLFQ